MIDQSVPLDELLAGQSALVHRVTGPTDDVRRLEEFGIRCGTQLEVFSRGNPCILRMAGNKVCLRTSEQLRVLVERRLG